MTTPRTMTDTELLDTLERLDKRATKGPWFARVMPGGSIRVDNGDSKTRGKMPKRPSQQTIYRVEEVYMSRGEREANAEIAELFGTHRARLIELARRGLDA